MRAFDTPMLASLASGCTSPAMRYNSTRVPSDYSFRFHLRDPETVLT
jgi:hypothetical protein